MPLDATDVKALPDLTLLDPLESTDVVAAWRPGDSTPPYLKKTTIAAIATAVGGGGSDLTIKNNGTVISSAAVSLDFASAKKAAAVTVTNAAGTETVTVSSFWRSVQDSAFGAVGDGTTDDTAALVLAAAAGVDLVVQPGTYKVTGNVTFPHAVEVQTGATFVASSAVTVTFNGGLLAPPAARIFTLSGGAAVTFGVAQDLVRPEWWGAVTYAASAFPVGSPTDSAAAIQAAINSGASLVQLVGADYYITAAIAMLNTNQTFRGVAANQSGNAGGSRLAINSATIDGITVGPASQPGGAPTTWMEHVRVADLMIIRSVAPTSIQNTSGFNGYQTSPSGMRVRYVVNSRFENVVSQDSTNGFYIIGAIYCKFTDLKALRTIAPNGSGFDYFHGVSQDNTPVISGFVSGNASLYYHRCGGFGAGGSFPGGSAGIQIYGGFSDTFLDMFEVSSLATGISANGAGTSGGAVTSEDLLISNCVIDVVTANGILITNGDFSTAVNISGCYIAVAGSGNGIAVTGETGCVSITGNQIRGISGSTATGINVYGGTLTGVNSVNNILADLTNPVVFNNVGLCSTQDIINNYNIAASQGVYITGSSFRCQARPTQRAYVVSGGLGIKVDNGCDWLSVDVSGIDPGALTGATSANKLVYNGSQITSAGAFASHSLVSGVMV